MTYILGLNAYHADAAACLVKDGELIAAVGEAEVLVPTVTDRIDKDVIAASGKQLKLIASFGTGVDHIDLWFIHWPDPGVPLEEIVASWHDDEAAFATLRTPYLLY